MSKAGSRDAVAGFLAVDALHKSVMPFVLRRTKAQVLQDLPPKIIQDVYCTLSPLQQRLYHDFKASPVRAASTGVFCFGSSWYDSRCHPVQQLP